MSKGNEFLVMTNDELSYWRKELGADSTIGRWLATSIQRNPANAILFAIRDIDRIAGRNVEFPDNVNLTPIEQLRHLEIIDIDKLSGKLPLSKAKDALRRFQLKLTREAGSSLEAFISDEVIKDFSEQEAQLALVYVYTLATLNNLAQDPNQIQNSRSLVRQNINQNEKARLYVQQFVEYVNELKAKADSKPLVRKLFQELASRVKKDWSCSIGMTDEEVKGFIKQLAGGNFSTLQD